MVTTGSHMRVTVSGAEAFVRVIRAVAEITQEVAAERDRARDIAVQLEQENAHLTNLLGLLASDLREMHAAEAIDLDAWPNAKAVAEWRSL